VNSSGHMLGPLVGSCKDNNDPLGSIKSREYPVTCKFLIMVAHNENSLTFSRTFLS
jgi:hypothetical protein